MVSVDSIMRDGVGSIMRDGVVLPLMVLFDRPAGILCYHILKILGFASYDRSTDFGHTVGGPIDCKCFAGVTSRCSNLIDRSFEFGSEREEDWLLLRCQKTHF